MRVLVIALTLLLLWLQYRLWLGEGGMRSVRQDQQRLEGSTQEIQRLRLRNESLEAEITDLKEGLDAVEERARQDLGMLKPDEIFVRIVERSEPRPEPPPVPRAVLPPRVTPPAVQPNKPKAIQPKPPRDDDE